MCEPTTIAAIALTVAGGLYSADAANEAGKAQQQILARNEETDRQRAQLANRIGSVQEDRHRAKVRHMLGAQRANLAARGIDPDSGTALALQDETVSFGETDAMTIRYNAAREAWGFGVSADNAATERAVVGASTRNAVRGTLLTTAASAFSIGSAAWARRGPSGVAGTPKYTPTGYGGAAVYSPGSYRLS